MFTQSLFALGVTVLATLSGASAVPAAAQPNTAACPSTTTFTTSYTGEVLAPGTTYPYTTTVVITDVIYPSTTITDTRTNTWTYGGTTSTTTWTETVTSTNYYGPFPGC